MSTDIEFYVKIISELVGVVSVVVGVVMSIKSFNAAREEEANAREKEAKVRYAEAIKPFRELREKRYLEVVHVAAILSSPDADLYAKDEIKAAKRRFRELYVAELSMVESEQLESTMVKFAEKLDPDLISFTPAQREAFKLAHKLGDEFLASSGLSRDDVRLFKTQKKESSTVSLK